MHTSQRRYTNHTSPGVWQQGAAMGAAVPSAARARTGDRPHARLCAPGLCMSPDFRRRAPTTSDSAAVTDRATSAHHTSLRCPPANFLFYHALLAAYCLHNTSIPVSPSVQLQQTFRPTGMRRHLEKEGLCTPW